MIFDVYPRGKKRKVACRRDVTVPRIRRPYRYRRQSSPLDVVFCRRHLADGLVVAPTRLAAVGYDDVVVAVTEVIILPPQTIIRLRRI